MIGGVPPDGPMSEELIARVRRIRGALFTVQGRISGPPRDGQPNNVVTTAGYDGRSREERQLVRDEYHARRYTHGPIGPFIDPGYHHDEIGTPASDFRADGGARVLSVLQETWQDGIIPVVFIVPDNWLIDEARRHLEPIFRQPEYQAVCRAVCLGWEPSMDRPNREYVAWFQWLADVFPHALRYLHMVSDFDAPGNNDDLTPGRPDFKGNDGCWRNIAPYIHGYLSQSSTFEHPDHIDSDPRANGRTDFQQWVDRYRKSEPSSLPGRFRTGYAGWPRDSAWGPGIPIDVIAAEYGSYTTFWLRRGPRPGYASLEDESQAWGDAALAVGADGVFDGFHAERAVENLGLRSKIALAAVLTAEQVNAAPPVPDIVTRTKPGRPGGRPRRPKE